MRRVKEYLGEEHWIDVVWQLPQEVIYWAVIRALADASSQPGLSGKVISEITGVEVLEVIESRSPKL